MKMTKRTVSGGEYSSYDPANEIAQIEVEIASILYIIGLDGSNIDNYEIDDVINGIRESFKYSNDRFNSWGYAHDAINRKYSNALCTSVRRLYRWRKIARYVDQNG